MGQPTPAKRDTHAAAFSRVFTTFTADIDLTEQVAQAKCACSGMYVQNATAGALTFAWNDCSDTLNTIAVPANTILHLEMSAITIDVTTADTMTAVIVYWHSKGTK